MRGYVRNLPTLPLSRLPVAVTVTVGAAEVNRAFRYEADLHSSTCQEPPG